MTEGVIIGHRASARLGLNAFAGWVDLWQRERFGSHTPPFIKLAVVTEELGELADAMLAVLDHGPEEGRREHLEDELADVLIAAFGLAGVLEVDVEAAVAHKLDEVLERYGRSPA